MDEKYHVQRAPDRDSLSEKTLAFLRSYTKMMLAAHDLRGCPNLSVMHYALGEHNEHNIYFGTRKSFAKYQLLKQNHCVSCIVYEEHNGDRAVSIHGIAKELEGIEHDLAYQLFKANNRTEWYIDGADDIAMFVIKPTSIRFLDASDDGNMIVTDTRIA